MGTTLLNRCSFFNKKLQNLSTVESLQFFQQEAWKFPNANVEPGQFFLVRNLTLSEQHNGIWHLAKFCRQKHEILGIPVLNLARFFYKEAIKLGGFQCGTRTALILRSLKYCKQECWIWANIMIRSLKQWSISCNLLLRDT